MDKYNKYEVFFAENWGAKKSVSNGAIVLVPSGSNWNNFGHRNHFYMWLKGYKEAISIAVAFLDDSGRELFSKADNVVSKMFKTKVEDILPSSEFPDFFTMLFEMDDYRKIISRHGVEDGNGILASLNDLVYTRKNNPKVEWYAAAIKSEAFAMSFMRNSHTMFAFYNATSVLSGVEYENLAAAESQISLNFKLSGFQNEHNFKFEFGFEGIVPKQIAVVIGKNGVGKSRALSKIVEFALSENEPLRGKGKQRPMLGKIVAISTPGETYSTFPEPQNNGVIRYERLLPQRSLKHDEGGYSLAEILIQLAKIHEHQIAGNTRWELFEEVVSEFCEISSLVIGSSTNSREDYVPLQSLVRGSEQRTLEAVRRTDKNGIVLRKNDEFEIFPLSSGQMSFIRLAAQICLTVENATLILIDEPETHLHPNLITEFVGMLNKILELTGSIAIVATHSAYLVREVPRSQVHVIQERNGFVDVVTPRLRTFGADVGAISEFVFGDDIINRLVKDVERRMIVNPQLRNSWKDSVAEELSPEAVMYLMEVFKDRDDAEEL